MASQSPQKRKKLTPKQEKFCREVVKGASYSDAYRASYNYENCKTKTVWDKASELHRNVAVKARIEELQSRASERLLMSQQQYLERLERMAVADIRRYFTPEGNVVDINSLSEDEANLIEGCEVIESFTKVGERAEHTGYVKRLKLASKRQILKEYGDARGWNTKEGLASSEVKQDNRVVINYFTKQEAQHVHVTTDSSTTYLKPTPIPSISTDPGSSNDHPGTSQEFFLAGDGRTGGPIYSPDPIFRHEAESESVSDVPQRSTRAVTAGSGATADAAGVSEPMASAATDAAGDTGPSSSAAEDLHGDGDGGDLVLLRG